MVFPPTLPFFEGLFRIVPVSETQNRLPVSCNLACDLSMYLYIQSKGLVKHHSISIKYIFLYTSWVICIIASCAYYILLRSMLNN
jgi:hypothetical protein